MENDRFQQFLTHPPLLAGGESSSDAADEAFLNSPCDGVSFLSLLTHGTYDPSAETLNPIEMPKTKPLFVVEDDDLLSGESPPYNFFADEVPPSLPHHLPSLLSYEQQQPQNSGAKSPIRNPRFDNTASYMKQRSKQQQQQQQQRPSDKTRQLQKLLPWDGKVDMATVLEEAYRYIKFLQAQVSVLQSMPCESGGAAAAATSGGGILGKLNRQQLLQVAVNTPAVQTQLYAKGCCLYSMEQLMLLKKKSEKKALYHQMMLDSSVNPNSFLF